MLFSMRNAVLTIFVIIFLLFLRLLSVLPRFRKTSRCSRRRGEPTHLMVVLGSGGHTAEMFLLLRDLDTYSYNYRRYVISSGDTFSAQRAISFEESLAEKAQKRGRKYGGYSIATVTRARKIHQSLLTTPLSAAACIWDCLKLLCTQPELDAVTERYKYPYPDLIMANGPATATIMIFASLLLRFASLNATKQSMRVIYVESWARVKTASLSGKILSMAGICDRLLVQWEGLAKDGFEFRGQLIV